MTRYRLIYRCLICLPVLLCLFFHTGPAVAETGEYQVKAAMIYNMIRFMDWPEEALPASTPQFVVCVVGKGGLGSAVDALQGKQVKGKTVFVRPIPLSGGISGCQVLILSDQDKSSTASLLERTRSSMVLTVADSAGFARLGGTVGFVLQNGKVRFEINQTSAQRHRIRVSAQLLKLAQIVQEGP